MAFKLVIQMLGLCHFIENDNPGKRQCHLCVLLPRVPKDLSPHLHNPRLLFLKRQVVAPPLHGDGIHHDDIEGTRVTFRCVPVPGGRVEPPQPKLTGQLKDTVAVDDLVGSDSLQYSKFGIDFGETPHRSISSMILLQEGVLKEMDPAGDWVVGGAKAKPLPTYSTVEVGNLERVDIVVTEFKTEVSRVYTLASNDGNEVFVTLTADCDLRTSESPLPRPVVTDTKDEDFRAHYLYFPKHAAFAKQRDVPIQKVKMAKAKLASVEAEIAKGLEKFPSRYEFKMPPADRPELAGGGAYLNSLTGKIETGSGGGSDCQNGRQKRAVTFNLDHLV